MEPYIYFRGLRRVDHSVFCVTEGQKMYYDPIFRRKCPYSSGQQVKRSILEAIINNLGQERSPVTFVFIAPALEEGEVLSLCDPRYYDQLLGGWMHTAQKKKDKKKGKRGKKANEAIEQMKGSLLNEELLLTEENEENGKSRTLKRRSPFSISAMRPLHPLLASHTEEKMSFDRSDRPQINNKIIVRDSKGDVLTHEQIEELLAGTDRSLLRKWLKPAERATGLFVYDIAIDLRTLFTVSIEQKEPELTDKMIEELKANGWQVSSNTFGKCLVMPKELREKAIPAIAKALINWRITSNQSRTFSLMETLAISISSNANTIASSIRAKLLDDVNEKAKAIIEKVDGADLFVTLPCANYIVTVNESADALDKAEQKLIEMMMAFDYEHQV